jgi:TPR repeat protein
MARGAAAAIGILLWAGAAADASAADLQSATTAYEGGAYGAAFAEFRELAQSGDSQAILWLGYLYQEGQGTTQDYAAAMENFRRAADLGESLGFFYIGRLYSDGLGVQRDAVEAVRWFRQAAERGSAYGEFALAQAHESGDGAPRDLRAARRWYQAAADQDYDEARQALQRLSANPE